MLNDQVIKHTQLFENRKITWLSIGGFSRHDLLRYIRRNNKRISCEKDQIALTNELSKERDCQ